MKATTAKSFRDGGLFGAVCDPAAVAGVREGPGAVDTAPLSVIPTEVELDRDGTEDLIAEYEGLQQELLEHVGAVALGDDDAGGGDGSDAESGVMVLVTVHLSTFLLW